MMSMPVRLSEPNSDHLQEVWRSMSPVKYDKAMHSSDSTFLQGLPAATDTSLGRLITSLRETSSKPIVLVDVGCGTGTEEKRMAEAGVFDSIERVIGVDFNPLFVEEATRINTCAKVSFVCGDACDLEKGKKCSYFLVNVSGASLRSAARSSCDTESLTLPFVFYFLFPKLMFPFFSFFLFLPAQHLFAFKYLSRSVFYPASTTLLPRRLTTRTAFFRKMSWARLIDRWRPLATPFSLVSSMLALSSVERKNFTVRCFLFLFLFSPRSDTRTWMRCFCWCCFCWCATRLIICVSFPPFLCPFPSPCLSFTGVNPELCGTTEGADINLETSTIITVSGYRSKWRSSESAREMANKAGWNLVDLWVADVGLFLWGRGKAGVVPKP